MASKNYDDEDKQQDLTAEGRPRIRRPGAGRKPIGDGLISLSVTVRPSDLKILEVLGNGVCSVGLRKMVDIYMESEQKKLKKNREK